MAIGRVAGPALYSNLDRQGIPLYFTTNGQPLLYLDFAKNQVAINSTTDFTTEFFTVNGNVKLSNIIIDNSTISSVDNIFITPTTGNTIISSHVLPDNDFTRNIGSLTKRWVNVYADSLNMSGSTIGTEPNGNINITPKLGGYTNISNLEVTGMFSTFAGNIISSNVLITGGSINNTIIGNSVPAAGTFTILTTTNAQIQGGNISVYSVAGTTGLFSTLTSNNAQITGGLISNVIIVDSHIGGTDSTGSFVNLTAGNLSIYDYTISSTGNITLLANGVVDLSGTTLSNVGYPVFPTDAATIQYVQDNLVQFHPNSIGQGDSIIQINDPTLGVASVTIDGNVIATFSNSSVTLANLTVSTSAIYNTTGNIGLVPLSGKVINMFANSALLLPSGSFLERPINPVPGYIRFNNTSNILEFYDGTEWINAIARFGTEFLVADGFTSSFSLSQTAFADQMLVIINGVIQLPDVAYTVTGSTLTFAEIPLVTDIIQVRYLSHTISSKASLPPASIVDTAAIVLSTSNLLPTAIDTFSINSYRSARYTLSASSFSGEAQLLDILVTQNGSTASISHSETAMIGGPTVITYSVSVSGGMCTLSAWASPSIIKVRVQKVYFSL